MRLTVLLLAPFLLGGCASLPNALETSASTHVAAAAPLTPEATEVRDVLQRVAHGEPVGLGGDRTLVITSRRPASLQPETVTFEVAASHADFVYRMGGTNAVGAAEVDCGAGRVRLHSVAIQVGRETQTISADGSAADWTAPQAGSALAVLVSEACPLFPRVTAGPIVADASGQAAPAAVAADGRPAVQVEASQSARVTVDEAKAPVGAAPVAPPPSASPAGAEVPRSVVAANGPAVVQIGAFATPEQAQAAIAQADAALKQPEQASHGFAIERVVVRGIRLFRAYIRGFTHQAEAQSLCSDLKVHGQECFVRRMS